MKASKRISELQSIDKLVVAQKVLHTMGLDMEYITLTQGLKIVELLEALETEVLDAKGKNQNN